MPIYIHVSSTLYLCFYGIEVFNGVYDVTLLCHIASYYANFFTHIFLVVDRNR